ncbi:MAG: SDR family NAD(P)-dependent oxidoreductase [Myxococcota bacterium]
MDWKGRVAVVTGAASGIGLATARRFAREGMKVVLADVERDALARAARLLEGDGGEVMSVVTDVGREESVAELAERTLERFGGVHVLFNNAGVFAGGRCWEATPADYEWAFRVNLWGVIHGLRRFVPHLIEAGEPAYVVNTASMAALVSGPLSGPYMLSKHAVLSLSETLYHELLGAAPWIGVSVLCPEAVNTRIIESARNRPDEPAGPPPEATALVENALRATISKGIEPEAIADRVLDAMDARRFYILPDDHEGWRLACESRLEDIRLGRNPTLVVPESAETG